MKILEDLITKSLLNYPEWAEYNEVILEFIRSYEKKRPDMCIEGCKSLIEGISKFVYFSLQVDQNENIWNQMKFKNKFENCIRSLKLDGYEEEFIQNNCELVFKLGQIRNERGDISHGQSYPKNSYSNTDLAKFISLWAEGLCYYILASYINLKQKETVLSEIYSPEQFEEFNNYLDEIHPDLQLISYSKALRDQDPLQYELLMDSYFQS